MDFVVIFTKENPSLFAYRRTGSKTDVLTTLFSNWNNTSFLWNYFNKYRRFLAKWGDEAEVLESAAGKTLKEARELNSKLRRLAENYENIPDAGQLDSLFRKLHNSDDGEVELRESKAYGINDPNWLRVYAIRIEKNCYLVTGGMIKLTAAMKEMGTPGNNEIKNLKSVKEFLTSKGIYNKESLIKYINEKTR